MTRPSTLPGDRSSSPESQVYESLRPDAASSHDESSSEAEPWTNRRATEQAVRAAQARQSSGRRRLVDPATCERDYADDEVEFMNAMQQYKKASGRMFPTWSEVLEVLISLGYRKVDPPVDESLSAMPEPSKPPKMARA
jgi:hypothetical protein